MLILNSYVLAQKRNDNKNKTVSMKTETMNTKSQKIMTDFMWNYPPH
jgi:hypothetical protein